ncbi:insulin-like growth factor 2 mRNA-binding protein 1 [Octopus bimaculoides]|nr:insulin-like growth factor 2 mRNA-binding protein 1 [Octopus bimaculoides]
MFKVYIGNLPPNISDSNLSGLLKEHGVETSHILLKSNYAFLDCPDQINVDKAIDKLNGFNLKGFPMLVEPSVSKRRYKCSILQNVYIPLLQNDLSRWTHYLFKFLVSNGVVYVTYNNPDQAQQVISQLNGYDFQGSILKADFASSRARNNQSNSNNGSGMVCGQDLPLRVLVGREYVGAIIGKQGQTIKQITSQSNARIDVHRPPDNSASETLVTIKGSSSSCTTACRELMKVIQQEATSLNRTNSLRILCPNSLCGRMIGKHGSVIKSIMQDSDSHITVSSINDANVNNHFIDRVITINASLDAMSKAEKMISERMRKFYAQDSQQMAYQPPMALGVPAFAMMPGINSFPTLRHPYPPYVQGNNWYPGFCGLLPNPQPPQQHQEEVTYLYIPKRAVGSIIGSKGINIQTIKRDSSARIKILPNNKGEGDEKKGSSSNMDERKAIIVGDLDAQWKAQFYLFEKVKDDGAFGKEEVKLRSEIMVPRSIIGRIIGRGGQNLQELRRVSRAIVKLPDDFTEDDVPVTIIGNFYSLQSAQRRIRDLMVSALHSAGPPQIPHQQQQPPLIPLPQPPVSYHQNRTVKTSREQEVN